MQILFETMIITLIRRFLSRYSSIRPDQHLDQETSSTVSGPQLYTNNITNTTNNNDIKNNLSNNNRVTYDTYRYNYNSCDSTYETSDTFVPEHSTYDYYGATSVANDIYGIESPSILRPSIAEPIITDTTPLTTPLTALTSLTTPLVKEPGNTPDVQ